MLHDLIAAGTVPVLRLTEVFRQAAESGIVRGAHRINRGLAPEFGHREGGPADIYGIRVDRPEEAAAKLLELVAVRIPERFGLDPVEDVQVLTPVHRGPLGTRALNELLRERLNPDRASSSSAASCGWRWATRSCSSRTTTSARSTTATSAGS